MATTKTERTARFARFIHALNSVFPERADIIHGLFLAVLTKQHVLMIGLPGTAKSLLARSIGKGLGGTWWEKLLGRTSTPEDLFGPVSLKALEQDRYEHNIKGTFADVDFAFPDEIFKCGSSVLNLLLAAINERVFHNGTQAVPVPLRTVFGASNELPQGKELEALWDRFVLRYDVRYLARDDNFRAMVTADDIVIPPSGLTLEDLDAASAEVDAVKVTDATVDALIKIRSALRAEGIVASDRRWKWCLKLVKAEAWMNGRSETEAADLMCLIDSLWREPKERTKIAKTIGRIADPASASVAEHLDAAREAANKVSALSGGDRKAYADAAAEGLDIINKSAAALKQIAGASPRGAAVVASVRDEILALHKELVRVVSGRLQMSAPVV
jgi:MoxR-like ATPase